MFPLNVRPSYMQASAIVLTAAVLAYNTQVAASLASPSLGGTCENSNPLKPSIRVVPNSKLFVSEPEPQWFGNPANQKEDSTWTNANWLKSRFHFAFAEYRNNLNSNFGVMRVMNDDLVQPRRGFGTHGHQNMEILTYVVHGELTHQDNLGTKESLGRGSFQFMTAGKGVRHSEHNRGDVPLRFIQTWIVPTKSGLQPNYGSLDGNTCKEARRNELQHLVSSIEKKDVSTPVEIHQDLDGYTAELELAKSVKLDLEDDRQAYLLCVEGELEVNGETLKKHDACEILGGGRLDIKATGVEETEGGEVAHLLLYSMPKVDGAGRKDV